MPIDPAVRRTLLIALGGAVVVLLSLGVAVHGADGPDAPPETPPLVEPIPGDGQIWPYTSRSPEFGTRTLPLNVVVEGSHDVVRRGFRRRTDANWSMTHGAAPAEREPAIDIEAGDVVWLPAHGATRYTFVRTNRGAHWVRQDYQLYDGRYLGVRHHIRAFEVPSGSWTAMQGHVEYWDWFRLRHTVTSTADTRTAIADQFADDARVARVEQISLANPGRRDGDGMATLVEFGVLAGLVLVGGGWRRHDRLRGVIDSRRPWRLATLVLAVGGGYLGVRTAAIILEGWMGSLHPTIIAGAGYVVLAVGLPVAAYERSGGLPPGLAVLGAGAGLALALIVEYLALGLTVVPPGLVIHRVAVTISIGIIGAAGALSTADTDAGLTALGIGVGGWAIGLGLALFGLI